MPLSCAAVTRSANICAEIRVLLSELARWAQMAGELKSCGIAGNIWPSYGPMGLYSSALNGARAESMRVVARFCVMRLVNYCCFYQLTFLYSLQEAYYKLHVNPA